jgi:calcineurin-like phosphoesterase family protein
MSRTWVYSDPHFYHTGICRFTNDDGTKVRPWDDADEMSEELISRYNAVVHPDDRVYLLGDVAFTRKNLDKSLPRLMGRKVLVKGNHDTDKLSYYSQFFDDIRSYVVKKGFVMSHIPLHPDSLSRWGLNIHGHTHGNVMRLSDGSEDLRYYNACVEKTDYAPILLDDILKQRGIRT